jgi:hypothetical protein
MNGPTICELHGGIRAKLDELTVSKLTTEQSSLLLEAFTLLEAAVDAGQRMEDCIRARRAALEKIAKEAINGL